MHTDYRCTDACTLDKETNLILPTKSISSTYQSEFLKIHNIKCTNVIGSSHQVIPPIALLPKPAVNIRKINKVGNKER